MVFLTKKLWFPPAEEASLEGILAIGGDLSIARLKLAYTQGIFPWYNQGEPIIWYCPDPRMVLFPSELKVSKSMKQVLKNQKFSVTYNTNFRKVMARCKSTPRKDQQGTWITDEMQDAYVNLFEKGIASSVEVWQESELVGGLYGVDLGTVFCGESMFSTVSNASKLAFIHLVQKLKKEKYKLIDCQIYTDHLASLGAREISRKEFLSYL